MLLVVGIVVLAIAIGLLVAALLLLLRAFGQRAQSIHSAYGVGQQQARIAMQVNIVEGVGLLVLGLIFVGVWTLIPTEWELAVDNPLATPSVFVDFGTATPNGLPLATAVTSPTATPILLPSPAFFPTTSSDTGSFPSPAPTTPTPTNTPLPLPTATPSQRTATVTSGVGVWLRAQPSTTADQLEWVLDGSVIVVLPETQEGDGYNWQHVRTNNGLEGWVAVDFITYNP